MFITVEPQFNVLDLTPQSEETFKYRKCISEIIALESVKLNLKWQFYCI
jgi:hypothetical protein